MANTKVTENVIKDSAVVTAGIADDAVTTAKIPDSAITTAKIADNSVTTAKIPDDGVTTAKIADNQVTLAKMAGLARGKIIYGDSSGNPAALAVGSAGTVLTSDGTDISWAEEVATNYLPLSGGTLTGVLDADSGITVDNITIDGSTITAGASNDLTVDAVGDIILDADGGDIKFKDAGTLIGSLSNSSSDLVVTSSVQDKDIVFKGDDGGSAVTALTLDMSVGGQLLSAPLGVANPTYAFSNDSNTGMTRPTSDTLQFVTGGTERVRINSTGVGINTSSPSTWLEVKDDGSLDKDMVLIQGGGSSGAYKALQIKANNGDDIFHVNALTYDTCLVHGSAALGIGTASPAVPLDVRGNVNLTADDARIIIEEADGTNITWIGDHTGAGAGGLFLYNHGGTATVKLTADSHANYINNGNNFGIGTTSPAKPLEVKITSDGSLIRLNRNAVSGWDFSIGNTSTLTGVGAGALEFIPQNGNEANEFAIGKAGTTTPLLHIKNDQSYFTYKLGIGTTSPAYGLDVRDTIYSSVAATTKNLTLGDSTNGKTSAISTNNENLIFYHDGSTEAMRIDDNGRVGINQNGPQSTLDLDGTIIHGNIRSEPSATNTYTNGNALNGGVIEFVTDISGSDEYNCVITWAKGTWSAFSYEFTFAAASWARKLAGGGYHNNSGGTISGHTNKDLYGGNNESDLSISGTNQTIVFTIQCPNGTHPMVHAKFMIGGGAGHPDPSDFTVEWVAR